MPVYDFPDRKNHGDGNDDRLQDEFRRRGGIVDPYGQRVLSDQVRRLLSRTKSDERWHPDFFVAWGRGLFAVDAKTNMRGDDDDRYRISRDAIAAHRRWTAHNPEIPFYYVFSNLGVATVDDVMRYCRLDSVGDITGSYVSFGVDLPRHFDDVFGPPGDGAAGVVAFRPAA